MKKFILPPVVDLIIIAVIAVFFAFFRLEQHYGFEFDQERDYNIVKEIVVNKNFTLIGPRVVSSAGFYLGPYYYYLNVPAFLLFGGEPSFAAYFTGFINLAICFLIYLVLKKETNSRLVAVMAASLWISSANRSSWNVSFVPLFFLALMYLYFDILSKWRFKAVALITLVFSFSLHFHPQMIFLLPLWLYALSRRKLNLKQIIGVLSLFLIAFVPLVAFDLRHDMVNTNAAFRFLTTPSEAAAGTEGFRFLYSLKQFSTALVPLYPSFQHNLFLTSALIIALFILTLLFRRYFGLLLISLFALLTLSFYKEPTWPEYYHYLSGLSVLLLVFILGSKIKFARWLLLVLTVIVVYRNYVFVSTFLNPGSYFHKKAMMLYMLQENQPYQKLNIDNDFLYGEGLGFQPIREFYESKTGEYHPTLRFYVSYAGSPKHNDTKEAFGLYAVSKVEVSKE